MLGVGEWLGLEDIGKLSFMDVGHSTFAFYGFGARTDSHQETRGRFVSESMTTVSFCPV